MKPELTTDVIGVASDDLLAVIDANFDREDIEARWANCGYTIAVAERAKDEYERIACERLSFDDVDQAITESNLSCGMFPERVKWFFKGWILSANATAMASPMCAHCEGVEDVNLAAARIIAAEYRKALAVIEAIEERFCDGEDTYEDWKFMGNTAREYLLPPNADVMASADTQTPPKEQTL